jgi:hypothetical protein
VRPTHAVELPDRVDDIRTRLEGRGSGLKEDPHLSRGDPAQCGLPGDGRAENGRVRHRPAEFLRCSDGFAKLLLGDRIPDDLVPRVRARGFEGSDPFAELNGGRQDPLRVDLVPPSLSCTEDHGHGILCLSALRRAQDRGTDMHMISERAHCERIRQPLCIGARSDHDVLPHLPPPGARRAVTRRQAPWRSSPEARHNA